MSPQHPSEKTGGGRQMPIRTRISGELGGGGKGTSGLRLVGLRGVLFSHRWFSSATVGQLKHFLTPNSSQGKNPLQSNHSPLRPSPSPLAFVNAATCFTWWQPACEGSFCFSHLAVFHTDVSIVPTQSAVPSFLITTAH